MMNEMKVTTKPPPVDTFRDLLHDYLHGGRSKATKKTSTKEGSSVLQIFNSLKKRGVTSLRFRFGTKNITNQARTSWKGEDYKFFIDKFMTSYFPSYPNNLMNVAQLQRDEAFLEKFVLDYLNHQMLGEKKIGANGDVIINLRRGVLKIKANYTRRITYHRVAQFSRSNSYDFVRNYRAS